MSVKKIAILLAPGFEEIEAIAPYDIFKRAQLEVSLVSISEELVVASDRQLKVVCDQSLAQVNLEEWDALFLPGGKGGVASMNQSELLSEVLIKWSKSQKPLYAICAAPTVLDRLGLYREHSLTSHPSTQEALEQNYEYFEQCVVKSYPLYSARGAGAAAEMAFEILTDIIGEQESNKIRQAMVFE